MFKILSRDNKNDLLTIINQWWTTADMPEELCLANVVSIFKKGNTELLVGYAGPGARAHRAAQ